MHPDFRNMTCDSNAYTQASLETLEIFRIDLSEFVLRLSPKYVGMLKSPPPGVYLYGMISPLITFEQGRGYYSSVTVSRHNSQPDVLCFDDIWKHRGPIYDHEGRVMLIADPRYRGSYLEYPTWHPAAIYIAYIYALELFRYVNPLAQPYSNVERELLDLRRHVHSEFLPHFDGTYDSYLQNRGVHHFYDEDNEDLIDLGHRLKHFIGQSKYNVYRFYLSNTVLTVEKGNDFRVIEYYRMITSHMEEIRQGF